VKSLKRCLLHEAQSRSDLVSTTPENLRVILETLRQLLQTAEEPRIRARAARSLGKLGMEEAIPALCKAAAQDRDLSVRLSAMDALVWIAKPAWSRAMTETSKNQPTFNINQVGNINTGDVSILQGDQIGIQQNYAPAQNFDVLLADYKQLIAELQQKYPTATQEAAIAQAIDIEFQEIKQFQPQRWQNFLNLKRLWNGGQKAAIKVGEHFAEENPWGKGAIAFLEGVMEDEDKSS
jgi:HEAT repeats